jgi:nitroreductase
MRIPVQHLEQILEYSVKAPSGDNCQPWRFLRDADTLWLLIDPDRDTSLYNVRDTASHIACGALIENMSIAAQSLGYGLRVELFPKGGPENAVAHLGIEKGVAKKDDLLPYIAKRCTNRWPFRRAPLPPGAAGKLKESTKAIGGGELFLVESEEEKKSAAMAASVNDRLLFENRRMHDFLFSKIRWSREEVEQTRDGLDARALGLNAVQVRLFRMLAPWQAVRALNLFGFSRLVPMQSYALCKGSSALGLVQMDGMGPASFVNGGRLLQRVWLTATSLGLSFQPMTGITFLVNRLRLAGGEGLCDKHREIVYKAEERLKKVFPLKDSKAMVMLFRLGYGPPPVMSLRRPVHVENPA